MTTTADSFVTQWLAAGDGEQQTLGRLATTCSGLDADGILAAIGDPRLGHRALELFTDLMHPTDSLYYDAIYGAYQGQVDIRGWLIPTMASIDFVEFVPQAHTVVFDDGDGQSSVDEWQMIAVIGDERIPLPRGVSVRRYRDGWITWNCDVYDTGAFRVSADPDAAAPDLPDWPRVDWATAPATPAPPLSAAASAWLARRSTGSTGAPAHDGSGNGAHAPDTDVPASGLTNADVHALLHDPTTGYDTGVVVDLMHPTDSVYLDPLFGDFRGRDQIGAWLLDVMPKIGSVRFDQIGPVLFDGTTSAEEWIQVAVLPDGSTVPMMRGTSVRRYADGWVVYAADYFDTAPLGDPAIVAAAIAAGSTLTATDIIRHRRI
jgi:hypothetical protein